MLKTASASAIIWVCTDIVRHAVTRMTQSDMTDTTSVKHPVRPTFQVWHVLRNLRLAEKPEVTRMTVYRHVPRSEWG